MNDRSSLYERKACLAYVSGRKLLIQAIQKARFVLQEVTRVLEWCSKSKTHHIAELHKSDKHF